MDEDTERFRAYRRTGWEDRPRGSSFLGDCVDMAEVQSGGKADAPHAAAVGSRQADQEFVVALVAVFVVAGTIAVPRPRFVGAEAVAVCTCWYLWLVGRVGHGSSVRLVATVHFAIAVGAAHQHSLEAAVEQVAHRWTQSQSPRFAAAQYELACWHALCWIYMYHLQYLNRALVQDGL